MSLFSGSVGSPGSLGSASRFLLPHERMVAAVRFHPAILIGPIFTALAGLSVAAVVNTGVRPSPDVQLGVWAAWGFLLLYLAARVMRWFNDLFLVTSERLMVISGILGLDVASMPLARAAGMRLRRTVMGRIFGYGHLVFEAGRRDQVMRIVRFIPYPEQIYLEINEKIYSDGDRYSDQRLDPS